jgi:hypothetical protein
MHFIGPPDFKITYGNNNVIEAFRWPENTVSSVYERVSKTWTFLFRADVVQFCSRQRIDLQLYL